MRLAATVLLCAACGASAAPTASPSPPPAAPRDETFTLTEGSERTVRGVTVRFAHTGHKHGDGFTTAMYGFTIAGQEVELRGEEELVGEWVAGGALVSIEGHAQRGEVTVTVYAAAPPAAPLHEDAAAELVVAEAQKRGHADGDSGYRVEENVLHYRGAGWHAVFGLYTRRFYVLAANGA